jgi:hypothetical protein
MIHVDGDLYLSPIIRSDKQPITTICFHLEVGGAGGQDHLVGLGALPVTRDGHVRERLLVPGRNEA